MNGTAYFTCRSQSKHKNQNQSKGTNIGGTLCLNKQKKRLSMVVSLHSDDSLHDWLHQIELQIIDLDCNKLWRDNFGLEFCDYNIPTT